MATYLVDTNVIIHVLRDQKGRRNLLKQLLEQDHLLASCPITITEVYAGMNQKEQNKTSELMNSLQFLPTTVQIAEQAGLLKRDYGRKGVTLSLPDATIAATAIANGCTLLTENAKDFPMPDLALHPL
jgi:predicted nucleic acid-binding protein